MHLLTNAREQIAVLQSGVRDIQRLEAQLQEEVREVEQLRRSLEAKEELVIELDNLVDDLRSTGQKQQEALEEVEADLKEKVRLFVRYFST